MPNVNMAIKEAKQLSSILDFRYLYHFSKMEHILFLYGQIISFWISFGKRRTTKDIKSAVSKTIVRVQRTVITGTLDWNMKELPRPNR